MDEKKKLEEQERLRSFLCPEKDNRENPPHGVLLSDQIEHYVESFKMIEPFKKERLKPAGYELTVGDEYVLGGTQRPLKPDGAIKIRPFNVVVIKTEETINLPRFLIARWNIRVKWAYKGLLWVGAAQVDPGWVGHLFCPIYNLSDQEVEVRAGDAIALMDFVTTTPFQPGQSRTYENLQDRAPKRILLEDYNASELKSGLKELAEEKLLAFSKEIQEAKSSAEDQIRTLRDRIDYFITINVTLLGILFAAGAVFATEPERPHWWEPGIFWVCVIAIALSGVALARTGGFQRGASQHSRVTFAVLWIAIFVLFGVELTWQWHMQNQIKNLRPETPVTTAPKTSGPKSTRSR